MGRSEGLVKRGERTSKSAGKWRMGKEVQWSKVKWSEDLWWNVCYVIDVYLCSCICVLCGMLCPIVIGFILVILLIARLVFFNICLFFCFVYFVFCVLFILLYSAVPFLYFVQFYRPLPPGGNPTAVNKYHIVSYSRIPSITIRRFLCLSICLLLQSHTAVLTDVL